MSRATKLSSIRETENVVRVSVCLPPSLVERIDIAAKASSISRSSFLAEAAEQKILTDQLVQKCYEEMAKDPKIAKKFVKTIKSAIDSEKSAEDYEQLPLS